MEPGSGDQKLILPVPETNPSPSRLPIVHFHVDMWAGVGRGGAEMSCSCVAGGA